MDTVTIGGLAELAGVHIETIRYYERRGLLAVPPRSAGGYRLYDEQHVWRLAFIRRAKDLGFTLGEITELFGPESARTPDGVRAAALTKLAEVEAEIRTLSAQHCQLRRLIELCVHGDGEACQALRIETES